MAKRSPKIHQQTKVEAKKFSEPNTSGIIYKISQWVESHPFIVLVSLSLLLISYIFKEFILLEKVYLFKDIGSDSVNVFWPQFVHLSDYLRQDGFPKWSFREGMGQDYFAFSMGDPFRLLFAFLGKNKIPFALVYAEAMKILLAGIFFFAFLRKLNLSGLTSICGALMYSFSGYMLIGGSWYEFSYEGMYIALLLWSLELFLSEKKWQLIPLVIFLIAIHQPFHLFHAAILTLTYLICRSVFIYRLDTRKFTMSIAYLMLAGLLGILLSSVFLFTDLEQMLQSPRGSGEASYFNILSSKPIFAFVDPMQMVSVLMRSFSSDMLGVGNDFKGFSNYLESPMSYCGLLGYLLAPQLFVFLDRKKRIALAVLCFICILPMVFPYFRYAFWLFSGDYFRMFSLFEIGAFLMISLAALHVIAKNGKINLMLLAASLLSALLILYVPWDLKEKIINNDLRWNATMFLVAYAMLLLMFSSEKNQAMAKILLLLLLVLELGIFSEYPYSKRKIISADELKAKAGYNDYSVEALQFLQENDSSFYRIIKDFSSGPAMHGSLNDAKIQGFNSTSLYHSFPQGNYIKFLEKTGVIHPGVEYEARWTSGLLARPLLQSTAGVKYILSKNRANNFAGTGYDSIQGFGDIRVFKNRYVLPMGFCYERIVSDKTFESVSNMEKDKLFLKACVSSSDEFSSDIERIAIADTGKTFTFDEFKFLTDKLREDTLHITKHQESFFGGDISLNKKKLMYLSIPYDKGWTALVDGKNSTLKHANYGFMALELEKGNHHIELSFEPPYLKIGAIASGIGICIYLLFLLLLKKKSEPVTNG